TRHAPRATHHEDAMTQPQTSAPAGSGFVEEVELQGHIIDSLILPKVLDEILTHGGTYTLKDIRVGQRQTDSSYARIEVRAPRVPRVDVRVGCRFVVGRQGLRVFPAETSARQNLFEFMASPVSSEKPKGVTVREIAATMRRTRQAGEKILAVLGPAVVHTGSV